MMYRKILIPIDGSRMAGQALGKRIALAKESRARIRLLHVADPYGLARPPRLKPRLLVGSSAERVIRTSPVPVLAIRTRKHTR